MRFYACSDVQVLSQSHESFIRGFHFYERRADKAYSLTDCISMSHMKAKGIRDVLTSDRHFVQEGFNALMKL